MKIITDIVYSSPDCVDLKLDIYLPESKNFDTLIFFHGGGLESGDKGDNAIEFKAIANAGFAVVSANYRMYPYARFPEFIEDAVRAVCWTKNNIDKYGMSEKMYIAGSSAGAYIVSMLCFDKRYLAEKGLDPDSFAGFIFDAGQQTTHFRVLGERGLDGRKIMVDEAAPLYHISYNPNYPKMTFIVSDNDIKNRLEETNLMCTALKTFGNDQSRIKYMLIKDSSHCSYHSKLDENGNSIFAKILLEALTAF